MKYIKYYRLFESNEKSYELIGSSDMFPEEFGLDDLDDKKISDDMVKRIINQFPKLKISKINPFYIHRLNCTTICNMNYYPYLCIVNLIN